MNKSEKRADVMDASVKEMDLNLNVNVNPGLALQTAREAKKMTHEEVANSIHLSLKQIQALENNQFNALPLPMITRGFIRNYARLLEIDAEPLLSSYRILMPDQNAGSLLVKSNVNQVMTHKDNQSWLNYILGSILVLLFLLAWFYYMDSMTKAPELSNKTSGALAKSETTINETTINVQPATSTSALATQSSGVPLVAAADATIENIIPATGNPAVASSVLVNSTANGDLSNSVSTVNVPLSTNVSVSNSAVNNAIPASSQPVATQNTKPMQNVVTVQSVAESQKINNGVQMPVSNSNNVTTATKKVSMAFTAQTWVRVTDKAGKLIFEKTLPAGATDGFDGDAPFKITIGNAGATKLIYQGREVDLTASTSKNVSRLTLE